MDKLDIEFQARLLPGNTTKPSALKKNLLPIFQRQKQKGNDKYKHQISNISVDGNSPDKEGVAKISIHFKKDNKPEAVSRLVDMLIAKMDDPTHKVIENEIPELELPNSKKGKPMEKEQDTNTKVSSNGKQRLRISMFVISCFPLHWFGYSFHFKL